MYKEIILKYFVLCSIIVTKCKQKNTVHLMIRQLFCYYFNV